MRFHTTIVKKRNYISVETDGNGDHHVKQNKPESQRQMLHIFFHVGHLAERRI
jgi:hypothetical protein